MRKKIQLKELAETKAEAFKLLYVRDSLTSKDNDKISFHCCRMKPPGGETDRSTQTVEAFVTGCVRRILAQPGTEVPANTMIAVVGELGDEVQPLREYGGGTR